jgi:hypothetical protein
MFLEGIDRAVAAMTSLDSNLLVMFATADFE